MAPLAGVLYYKPMIKGWLYLFIYFGLFVCLFFVVVVLVGVFCGGGNILRQGKRSTGQAEESLLQVSQLTELKQKQGWTNYPN